MALQSVLIFVLMVRRGWRSAQIKIWELR